MRRFENQVAIVTGAANGIGAATARRLAQEGAAVVVADMDEVGAEQSVEGFITGHQLVIDGGQLTF